MRRRAFPCTGRTAGGALSFKDCEDFQCSNCQMSECLSPLMPRKAIRVGGLMADAGDEDPASQPIQPSVCRWVVYSHALSLFRVLEEELLRLATHYLEQYAMQLHAAGKGQEVDELDRCVRRVCGFARVGGWERVWMCTFFMCVEGGTYRLQQYAMQGRAKRCISLIGVLMCVCDCVCGCGGVDFHIEVAIT